MPRAVLTPELQALIVDAPPPDIQPIIARGDPTKLRMAMETHALIELPFDKLFAAVEAAAGQAPAQQAPAATVRPATASAARPAATAAPKPAAAPAPEPAPATRRRGAQPKPTAPQEPAYPKGTVIIPCDSCGAKMADTDEVCWKCGAKYEIDPPEPKPAPTPPPARGVKAAPAAPPSDADETGAPGDDQDLPW
jgi:hypothetical protein